MSKKISKWTLIISNFGYTMDHRHGTSKRHVGALKFIIYNNEKENSTAHLPYWSFKRIREQAKSLKTYLLWSSTSSQNLIGCIPQDLQRRGSDCKTGNSQNYFRCPSCVILFKMLFLSLRPTRITVYKKIANTSRSPQACQKRKGNG